MAQKNDLMEKIVSLCKRRGFVYPSAEIYGGTGSVWDYGPMGVLLKNNVKAEWWRQMVQLRDDVVGLDSAILTRREVLQASGHEKGFSDPLVECKKCHNRYRADHIDEAPKCEKGGEHEFTEAKEFNLMFKTFMGPVDDEKNLAYLRPETAQGIFANFKNVLETSRRKVPFGIAQIGKSFRNEITPGNFTFRTREFEQMELEYFVRPEDAPEWYEKWVKVREKWYLDFGIKKENLRIREHEKKELAHYAAAATDVEYQFPFGWSELEGIANRQDFDLKTHDEHAGRDLKYFDEESKKKFWPYVIEPSAGADRATLAFLVDAFEEKSQARSATPPNLPLIRGGEEGSRIATSFNDQSSNDRNEGEVVLHLHPRLAPVKAAVLPLVKKGGLAEKAAELHRSLQKSFMTQYDESGSIGRRYRRQDEIGTPWCVTIDFETLEKGTVTVRDRDSMKQERIATDEVKNYLQEKLNA